MNSADPSLPQDPQPQPREIHDPLADDKRTLFEVPAVDRLAGVWQGPGSIAELRRQPERQRRERLTRRGAGWPA